jgi:hypothetical protein
MSQAIWSTINPATTSGVQLATLLNDFKAAVVSGFSGSARPVNLQAGGYWVDTTNEASPNFYWDVKVYTGTADITVFRLNLSTNTATFSSAESLFTVERTSADSVGPIIKFLKERIANSGQTLTGDYLGELQFVGAGDDGGNPIICRIRAVSSDDTSVSASGGYLVFEATVDGQTAISEMMRLIDGKLGIGTTSPEAVLHAVGVLGLKSEAKSDDANGSIIHLKKKRITGAGQVQNNDLIGTVKFSSTDESGLEVDTFKIENKATELQTSTAQGSSVSFNIKANGSSSYTEIQTATASELSNKVLTSLTGVKLESADVASSATITQLSSSKAIINITGSTETTIQGINSGGITKVIVIHNSSTANVFLAHENTSAAAADRCKLPKSKAIKIIPDSSLELFYKVDESRWKVKSGSGSGGGEPVITTVTGLFDGNTLSLQDESIQMFLVEADSISATLASAPFGSTVLGTDGSEITIVGTSDDNPVIINSVDSSKGVVLNGARIVLTRFASLTVKWIASLDRYVEKSRS